jgi:hypothetical protein
MSSRSIVESVPAVEPETCRDELQRVLSSATFAKAPRLCSMLEYIAGRSLAGHLEDLTEQQIGIQVFGRAPGYNSGEDTIVRGTARLLRQRLEHYYNEEGLRNPMRIGIPKGGYVARFEPAPLVAEGSVAARPLADHELRALQAPADVRQLRWPRQAVVWIALLACLAVALPILTYFLTRSGAAIPQRVGPQALWQALFVSGRKTLIVPGDASLDAYEAWEQTDVNLEGYATQKYQNQITTSRPPGNHDVPISTRSVTPMADLRLVSELVRAPLHMGQPQLESWVEIRYARDVAIADTHDNNLILIGSESFNPWVTLYHPAMDFEAHWDYKTDVYTVVNRAPASGESASYSYNRRDGETQKALTHIALVDNTQGQGRVLIVEGTSMGTTYGAVNFLTHETLWSPVMKKVTDSSGHIRNFDLLLSGNFVHGGVSNSQVLALHVH